MGLQACEAVLLLIEMETPHSCDPATWGKTP